MEFKVAFYTDNSGKSPVAEFLNTLKISNRPLWAKTLLGLEKIKFRVYHKEPLSKHVEQGLWEMRIKSGTDILRILYTFQKGQIIILLHSFVKKQQKTPTGELEIARKRLREIKAKEAN